MRLPAGTRLGPYEIESAIGAGGMGEVYQARDSRLDRTVAIKTLPQTLAGDSDRRARFQREAKTIAGLNHPHICTLYDVGEADGITFLVMEHLSGETLAKRLEKGPLPLDQALTIATEIADALATAHRQGIIHRDLKPGNVMLTRSGAKLLDFGLAKLAGHSERSAAESLASAATATRPLTAEGVIVGTLQYMAPEQIAGKEADACSDIFSFGAVVYEMVTGKRAFDGDSHASVIAAVISSEPAPISATQPLTPVALDRTVRRCLAKDRDQRWQSAADLAQQLRWIALPDTSAPGGNRATRSSRAAVAFLMVALLGIVAGVAAWWQLLGVPASVRSHVTISVAELGLTLTDGGVAVSPDGRTLVFTARASESDSQLYARRLDEWPARPLKGTEGALAPFFSPDGAWVAFMAGGLLKKVPLSEGPPQTICKAGYQGSSRGAWGTDGFIVASQWPGVPLRVSADGGTPKAVASLPSGPRYLWPSVLPDGKSVLLTVSAQNQRRVVSLLTTGDMRTVIGSASCARYLPTGHLVYEEEGRLKAARFDPERLQRLGDSRVVIDDIAIGASLGAADDYDVSRTGTIVYLPASSPKTKLVWRDREGRIMPLAFAARRYAFPSLSPDGREVALAVYDGTATDIWSGRVDGEPLTRLASGGATCPIFSPDGSWVYFSLTRENGLPNLARIQIDGSAPPERLLDIPAAQKPTSVSRDGTLLFNEAGPAGDRHLMQMNVSRPASRAPFGTGSSNEIEAVISPDGKWVAYQSDETHQWQVYVRPYAGPGPRRQISIEEGMGPVWNPRGGELFYQTRTALMSVRIFDGVPTAPPRKLFSCRKNDDRREFDTADGEHFLFMEPATPRTEINVITNWFEELKAKVPAPR